MQAVVCICCLPACLTPESLYASKQEAYQALHTGIKQFLLLPPAWALTQVGLGAHWPNKEGWFRPHPRRTVQMKPYYAAPPELTHRQQELYGLCRYEPQDDVSNKTVSADAPAEQDVLQVCRQPHPLEECLRRGGSITQSQSHEFFVFFYSNKTE